MDNILELIQRLLKQRLLTSSILTSVSNIILTLPENCACYAPLFDIAWNVRSVVGLKEGAYELLTSLFPRIPSSPTKVTSFYHKRVYAHTEDDSKVARSLRFFEKLVFKGRTDMRYYSWQWSPKSISNELYYLKFDVDPNTPQLFVKHFLHKSNFAVCPDEFCRIILIIAHMNFDDFIINILPEFLKLPPNDPRFIVLLRAACLMDTPAFRLSPVKLNKALLSVVSPLFPTLSPGDISLSIETPDTADNDRIIAQILSEWGVCTFAPTIHSILKSDNSLDQYSLDVQLVRISRYCLNIDNEYMQRLLQLCFSRHGLVAQSALEICRDLLLDKPDFIHVLMEHLLKFSSKASDYVALHLLDETLAKKPPLSKPMLKDIEYISFVGLTSVFPAHRVLSYNVMKRLNSPFYIVMHQQTRNIETQVRTQIIMQAESDTTSDQYISFSQACSSSYYDIWFVYMEQLATILVLMNYSPLINRLKKLDTSIFANENHEYVGLVVLFFAAHAFCEEPSLTYNVRPYKPVAQIDTRTTAIPVLSSMLAHNNGWSDRLTFTIIRHIHLSYLSVVFSLLSTVRADLMVEAANTLSVLMNDPECTFTLLERSVTQYIAFMQIFQSHLLSIGANDARSIPWTPELEQSLESHETAICLCCKMFTRLFGLLANLGTDEDLWPLSSRELVFHLLVNWAKTSSLKLQKVRECAKSSLTSIVRIGPLLTDSLWLGPKEIELFAEIEQQTPILSFIIYFHVEQVLDLFIGAALKSKKGILFFQSLFMAFNGGETNFLSNSMGELLLVGLVFKQLEAPSADDYLQALLDLANLTTSTKIDKVDPQHFLFALESLFYAAFRFMRGPMAVSVKDFVEAIRPYLRVLRLLPKQTNLVPGTSSKNRHFTPYQFLVALIGITEYYAADEESFTAVMHLWTDLLESNENAQLVPLFISEWQNATIKQQVFLRLLQTHPSSIMHRLVLHCSFAYYFHVTACLGRDFTHEFWIIPLFEETFKRENQAMIEFVPDIIHFVFLFYEHTQSLLENLCRIYMIPPHQQFLSTVKAFVDKCEDTEQWGKEALRWLFASQSLTIASRSLQIFNCILAPIDTLVIDGINKSVIFHILNNSAITTDLTTLVSESFKFFNSIFTIAPTYAFKYAAAFLDCRQFVESCLADAAQLFIRSLSHHDTHVQAWTLVTPIVRPLLTRLEVDEQVQKIFDLLIRTSMSDELKMIVAPLKIVRPELFPSMTQSIDALLQAVTESTLFKSLEYYATMIDTSTPPLLNAIFKITAFIVSRDVNENNRNHLAKLYKCAVANITLPNAVHFIGIIAGSDPSVAVAGVYEYYDWDRSVEDVARQLASLLTTDDGYATITDCNSLDAVYNLLNSDVVPKILPFATQQEMIEGMREVVTATRVKRSQSIRRWSAGQPPPSERSLSNSSMLLPKQDEEFEPLVPPSTILFDDDSFVTPPYDGLLQTNDNFIRDLNVVF